MQSNIPLPVSSRIPVINSLRGISALAVCVYHLVNMPLDFVTDQDIRGFFDKGRYGVHIFFMISAVVIPLSMIRNNYALPHWGRFMLKRITRLEPPYLAALLLMICYRKLRVLLIPGSTDLTPDTTDLLLHIGYLVPFADGEWASIVFWTLAIEFQFYFVIALLLPLLLNNRIAYRLVFYAIFLLMPLVYGRAGLLPVYGPIFLAGIAYALLLHQKIVWKEFACVSITALIASFYFIPSPEATVAAYAALCLIHWVPQWSSRLTDFLGDISYSLYLIHPVSGLILVHLLSHQFNEPWQKVLIVLAGALFSILASWGFYRLIERPSMKLAGKIRFVKPEMVPQKMINPE